MRACGWLSGVTEERSEGGEGERGAYDERGFGSDLQLMVVVVVLGGWTSSCLTLRSSWEKKKKRQSLRRRRRMR